AIALAEPRAIHEVILDEATLERTKQDFLVVRELGQFARVLAVVEVLSPANKAGNYAPPYREKRMRCLASRSHFMEIDLLRCGQNPSRVLFPELPASPYFIGASRFLVGDFSQFRQHAGEDFQSEVVFVPKTVGLSLHGSDLIVESLDE